jgi:hypothetical protein
MGLVDVPIRHYFCDSLGQFSARHGGAWTITSSSDVRGLAERTLGPSGISAGSFASSPQLWLGCHLCYASSAVNVGYAVWLFHLPACWITLGVYGLATLRGRIRPRVFGRTGWRQ